MSLEAMKSYVPVVFLSTVAATVLPVISTTNPTVSTALGVLATAAGLYGCVSSIKKLNSERNIKNLGLNLLYAGTAALGIYQLYQSNKQFNEGLEATQQVQKNLDEMSQGLDQLKQSLKDKYQNLNEMKQNLDEMRQSVIEKDQRINELEQYAAKLFNNMGDIVNFNIKKFAKVYEVKNLLMQVNPYPLPSQEVFKEKLVKFCSDDFENDEVDQTRKGICDELKSYKVEEVIPPAYLPNFF